MRHIARLIDRVLTNVGDTAVYAAVKEDVKHFCREFTLYPTIDHSFAESAKKIEEGVGHIMEGVGKFMQSVGEELQQAMKKK